MLGATTQGAKMAVARLPRPVLALAVGIVILAGGYAVTTVSSAHRALAWLIFLTILLVTSSIYWFVSSTRHWRSSVLLYAAIACVLLVPVPLMIVIFVVVGAAPAGSN
jgi:hypothetical protein